MNPPSSIRRVYFCLLIDNQNVVFIIYSPKDKSHLFTGAKRGQKNSRNLEEQRALIFERQVYVN